MIKLVNKYRALNFEDKTIFGAKFSIIFNAILALGKIIVGIFSSIFFVVSGVVNVFIMISKQECYVGVKYPEKKTFEYRNKMIGLFLLFAGIQYAIYMARMIFTDVKLMEYGMILGIAIACVSFIELGVAIKGCFNSFGRGHYYRNIKLINLCSALTAIVLTEVALTSFAAETDTRLINGLFGLVVGLVIVLIAIFIFVAPKVSILDREHNVYKAAEQENIIEKDSIEIVLTDSKFYGNYTYVATKKDDLIDGHIKKGRSPLFGWNIYWKITIILFSEILIFPYAFGALVFYFKNGKLIKTLDDKMLELGYEKISESED